MKPMLFNTEMTRAILAGQKAVTRRVAFPANHLCPFPRKEYPNGWWFRGRAYRDWDCAMRDPQAVMSLCRYRPGDILYVRETWTPLCEAGRNHWRYLPTHGDYCYLSDGHCLCENQNCKWHPSIHMPKEAARLFLRITDIRVEQLQDITPGQCILEGVEQEALEKVGGEFVLGMFHDIWDSTIKPKDRALYGWDANPWVFVIRFERISKDEAQSLER